MDTVISSKARNRVMQALFPDPDRSYYQRQVEQATGLPLRAVQRELDRLTKAGLLFRREEGNRVYYQVNRDHPLFPEFQALTLKSAHPVQRLRHDLLEDPGTRLALITPDRARVILVTRNQRRPANAAWHGFTVEALSGEIFLERLASGDPELIKALREGRDLLGRREDVLWRYIEAAGFEVAREPGVP